MNPILPESSAAAPELTALAQLFLEKQLFSGYELLECLASGGPFAVFRARDDDLNRSVAIKVMNPHPDRKDAVEEFFSLAGSVAGLRTPAIARALDTGRCEGCFYMVYEFVSGETLAARLERRTTRYTEKEALQIAELVIRLLQVLYEKGQPYGSLRPSNLLLSRAGDGEAESFPGRFLDVGFAWKLGWATDEEAFAARPGYLPPEMLAGDPVVDVRGDLWSLGSILFRLLLGRPALLPGEKQPPDPRSLNPAMTARTAGLMRLLTMEDRASRPRTPKEVLPLLVAEGENL